MLPGYECVPVGPAAADPAALAALVGGAVQWAAAAGLRAVAFLYTRPTAAELAGVLAGRGFTPVPLSLHWDLELPGSDPSDYLAGLPGKRRKEARRELRELARAGVLLRPADPAEVFDDLVRLRSQLVAKYRGGVDPGALRVRLRRLVEQVAGGRPQVLVAEAGGSPGAGGSLVGFALFAEHPEPAGRTWHCLAVGFDYTDPRSRLAYFGTAFYAAAGAAYPAGIRRLGYGQGSWQAKRARGCRGTPLTGWVRAADPELAAAVRASAAATELIHDVAAI
jgi:predicted N-acyltransferase